MRRPLAADLVGMRADVEGEHALARQQPAHDIDRLMRCEARRRGAQRGLERFAVQLHGARGPAVSRGRQRSQPRQRIVEIAGHFVRDAHAGIDIGALDTDVQQRHLAYPGFVLHLDRVVAQPDHQIGALDQRALQFAQGALDAAERQRMVFVDQALGHHGGRER